MLLPEPLQPALADDGSAGAASTLVLRRLDELREDRGPTWVGRTHLHEAILASPAPVEAPGRAEHRDDWSDKKPGADPGADPGVEQPDGDDDCSDHPRPDGDPDQNGQDGQDGHEQNRRG